MAESIPLISETKYLTDDPRFERIQKSSLYRRPSNKKTQVILDKRFAPVLSDERFSSKAKVDRYGRKLRAATDSKNGRPNAELSKLYRLEAEKSNESDEGSEVQLGFSGISPKLGTQTYDPARDGGFEESSSSEDDSAEDSDVTEDEKEEELLDATAGADAEAVPQGEISRRLAVVNLDWDHIRAVDLLSVFSSYSANGSAGEKVEKVTIYPSEFGKERMQREEMEGPPKELFASRKRIASQAGKSISDDSINESGHSSEGSSHTNEEEEDDDDDEDERIRESLLKEDNGEEVSSTKLRSYQLERLRYFYAVVTCSSSRVAKEIYDNIDGREYLSSANFFDLRFIPDEMDFSEDKPREECSKIPHGYRPNEFVTAALQHSKVKLTWDAEDTQRKEIQQRAFSGSRKDLDENELRAYLASDNSSNEDEQEAVEIIDSTIGELSAPATHSQANAKPSKSELRRLEMRSKLGLGDQIADSKDQIKPVGDMQITFAPGLSTAENKNSVFENEPEIEETTAERYLRKERERKARRKEKLRAEKNGTSANDETIEEEPRRDEGFDDPFFTATPAEAEALAEQKKANKRKQKHAQRIAEEKVAASENADLERVMIAGSKDEAGVEVSHFSLAALEKAQKALRKQKMKKGKVRLSKSEKAALEARANDNFEMDVEDDRFAAVYERPEFSLDPSHPRFRDTEGMKSLLQEARDRRKRDIDEDSEGGAVESRKKARS